MRIASACGIAVLIGGCTSASDARLVGVARDYPAYGRVDDLLRWAPTDCKAPAPARPRPSASRDPDTHGRKLYYLYAKDFEAYRKGQVLDQPVGQVLVKESYSPAGERGPLFMMMKTGEPDSDAGWIYATLTPDGRTVTASGKLAS